MGQIIFADLVPLRQRPRYFALVLAAWALGTVLGPLVGGFVVEHYSWRWCFYINASWAPSTRFLLDTQPAPPLALDPGDEDPNPKQKGASTDRVPQLPFCLFGLIFVPIYVNLRAEKAPFASKLQRVDWIGGFLFLAGMTSFLVGLSWAGVQYDWLSVQTLLPMALGIAGVVLAVLWDCFGAREPMLKPWLFHSRSAVAAYTCAFLQGFVVRDRLLPPSPVSSDSGPNGY